MTIAAHFFTLRNGYGIFDAPSSSKSFTNLASVKSKFFRPLGGGESNLSVSYKVITSSVSGVFFSSNPATIVGCIISAIVNAVKLVFFGGLLSNIMSECKERFIPSFTDSDASGTIVFIAGAFRVVAPCFHGIPGTIKRVFVCHLRYITQIFFNTKRIVKNTRRISCF